ncbi:MFS transporter [Kistimonas asteriae]|uniref:MFS transporter n=1 Tax=Kistimonas asteriae TaxID=517724 RepID=UPI001BA76539|nr:MFS transporter [Kistimonas asteriae]
MLKKLVFITCLGAVLEFFDFAILLLFASQLADVFLPAHSDTGVLWMFAIYSGGNFIRPLGGIIFSHFGDRLGRKKLFRLSIIMMSVATLGIGLLPSYAAIGGMAVVLLACLRLLQGLSVGGELPGALVFAAEHVSPERRGLLTSAIIASAVLGLVLASTTGVVLNGLLSAEQLQDWGWRIPFVLGSLLGILGYFLRRGIVESPAFTRILQEQTVARIPVKDLFQSHAREILVGVGLIASAATMVSFYLFLTPYASRYLNLSEGSIYLVSTAIMLGLSMMTLLSGWLSDYLGRRRMLFAGGLLMLLVAWPAFSALQDGQLWLVALLTLLPAAIGNGCYEAALVELFDTRVRYTGVAVSLNIGVCVFGGGTPYVLELLSQMGYDKGPLLLMVTAAVIAMASSCLMTSRKGFALDEAVSQRLAARH